MSELIKEFERMLPEQRLDRKSQIIAETALVNRLIDDVDHLIEVYSAIDFIRVDELMKTRATYMSMLLDLLNENNDLYLSSIKSSPKAAVKSYKRA
jgi:hypothetical protein